MNLTLVILGVLVIIGLAVALILSDCAGLVFSLVLLWRVPLRARIVQEITDSGRPPLNQCNKRSQSIVNLIALLRAESAAFLYQVLTNRLMCGFYTLRKVGLDIVASPCRGARKRGEFQGYCASAVATLAQEAIPCCPFYGRKEKGRIEPASPNRQQRLTWQPVAIRFFRAGWASGMELE